MMCARTFGSLAVLLIGALLSACARSEGAPAVANKDVSQAPVLSTRNSGGTETIRFLENRLKRDPDDFIANNKLASEYLQQLRETGDITYLDLADRSARASLKTLPAEQNKGGLAALVLVEYSSHKFAESLNHAMRLTELDPGKGYVFQMIGDNLVELGEYEQADRAFTQMTELGGIQLITKVAMEQRHARVAMLRGNSGEAERRYAAALKNAEVMPAPPKETVAWCQWQLGETAFARGDHRRAEKFYLASLTTFPDYYRAVASLARLRAAQGDHNGAIELYEKVVRIFPDPVFVSALGDLYKLSGRDQEAADQYALVEKIGFLTELSGSLYNRQLALFYADHSLNADKAYQMATAEYERRRDIYGADAVAWTALNAGKIAEAQTAMKEALRLGTKDARLYYHAGMIENAAGNRTEAVRLLKLALNTSPGFDPMQATRAKATLEGLNG